MEIVSTFSVKGTGETIGKFRSLGAFMDNSGLTVAAAFGGDEQTLVSWSTHRSRRACEVWSPELFISLFKIYPLSRVLPGHFPDHVIVVDFLPCSYLVLLRLIHKTVICIVIDSH